MKRVLITGAGSYVGGKVRERLESEPEKFQVEELDVQDPSWKDYDFSGYDCVYHVAGIAHVSTDPSMEPLYMAVNRDLTIEVGKKAKTAGVPQLIFMSSAIVYGDSDPCDVFRPITKETPVNPSNFYGLSKVEAEIGLMELCDSTFRVAILRCPMIYGPGCKGNFPKLAKLARIMPVFPDIKNRRSMLYVGNLAELVAKLVELGNGGLYLPQNAEWSSTPEIVQLIGEMLGKKVIITKTLNPIIHEVFHKSSLFAKAFGNLYYMLSESASDLGYQKTSFIESIRQCMLYDPSVNDVTKMSALVVATVPSVIGQFCTSNIKLLQDLGYNVQVAANFNETSNWSLKKNAELKQHLEEQGIKVHQVDFSRRPTDIRKHWISLNKMHELCMSDDVRVLHVNTPIASAISRIASRKSKAKVLYTAHGFHFYTGAPFKNWLVYYPVEWLCSWFTDVIITINREDYSRASKHLHAKKTYYLPGVGVDVNRFSNIAGLRERTRTRLGLESKDFSILSVGELLPNKNHELVIRALGKLADSEHIKSIKYYICGEGPMKEYLQDLAEELGISENVHLLGYRDDIPEILAASDAFIFMSIREGLSVALMEAMSAGLPVICSPIRGNLDLVIDGQTGLIVDFNACDVSNAILYLVTHEATAKRMGNRGKEVIENFDKAKVDSSLKDIYLSTLS